MAEGFSGGFPLREEHVNWSLFMSLWRGPQVLVEEYGVQQPDAMPTLCGPGSSPHPHGTQCLLRSLLNLRHSWLGPGRASCLRRP